VIPPHRIDGPPGAPVLLLLSSLGTTGAMWEPQVRSLSARFRVVRSEHRGHGGAPAPAGPYTIDELASDAVELLDHLGVERASLCGLSLGGMVALRVAVRHPGRVERLVLACTAAELGPSEAWAARAETVRAAATASVLTDTLLARWFTPGFVEHHPEVAHELAAMLAEVDPEGYAGCCEAIAAMDQRGELGSVRAPTLVLCGADDPVTPPVRGLELQAGIPGASLCVLAGASHLANLQVPAQVTAALVDHLAGPAPERGAAMRRRVLGDAHVQRGGTDRWSAPFVDFVTATAWGEVWTRPGLDLRTRSCVTVALLAGLGRLDELALHLAGARRNGVSDDELVEVLVHTAVYAGAPAANAALAVARRVLGSGDGDPRPIR
jgi:3-oxoadipate enol-lactonase/4-carboxymuconolactone decarboxylase